MTIIINFHISNYRTFKHYYIDHFKQHACQLYQQELEQLQEALKKLHDLF